MRKYIYINLCIALLLALILAACSSKPQPTQAPKETAIPAGEDSGYLAPTEPSSSSTGIAAPSVFVPDYYPPPLPAGTILQVIISAKNIKTYTPDALKQLSDASVKSGDITANGIKLSSLLKDANITSYQMVSVVSGMQSINLSKDSVNDQVIIGFDKDGSLFLAIGDQPATQRLKQVNQIWYK